MEGPKMDPPCLSVQTSAGHCGATHRLHLRAPSMEGTPRGRAGMPPLWGGETWGVPSATGPSNATGTGPGRRWDWRRPPPLNSLSFSPEKSSAHLVPALDAVIAVWSHYSCVGLDWKYKMFIFTSRLQNWTDSP